jgi:hypothetical protein
LNKVSRGAATSRADSRETRARGTSERMPTLNPCPCGQPAAAPQTHNAFRGLRAIVRCSDERCLYRGTGRGDELFKRLARENIATTLQPRSHQWTSVVESRREIEAHELVGDSRSHHHHDAVVVLVVHRQPGDRERVPAQ